MHYPGHAPPRGPHHAKVTLHSGEIITVHRHRRCFLHEHPAAAVADHNGEHAICTGCGHKLRLA